VAAAVAWTYKQRRSELLQSAPPRPAKLDTQIQAQASKWEYAQNEGGRTKVIIRADGFREIKDPPQTELTGLELLIYKPDGKTYDLVRSKAARFTKGDRALFAEGDVSITMGVPEEGPQPNRVLSIETSGVRYELQTNKAMTDRPARFAFGQGNGQCVGAEYDPAAREIRLKSAVELSWTGGAAPMRVEAGEATYREKEGRVLLGPWARLKRGGLTLEGGATQVMLDQGIVRQVDTVDAKGADTQAARKLEFGAKVLTMNFAAKGAAEKIQGSQGSWLTTVTGQARTRMESGRIDLRFGGGEKESALEQAFAQDGARVESTSSNARRILTSDVVEMKMRPGGEEIETVMTHAPGRLELAPATAAERRRVLEGERLSMQYGARNQIQTLRAVQSSTRTEPPAARREMPPMLTWSADLQADFDPKSGDLARLEQWSQFRYQEGERRATADRAVLEQDVQRITLTDKARVWDPSGSTDAQRIVLEQKTGDFTALGQVRSVREPERKAANGASTASTMSSEEPVRATADEMFATDRNRKIRYLGKAVMWQGANRLSANRIEIDRPQQRLRAFGQVVSQLRDAETKAGQNVFTIVRAPELDYSDSGKLAHYRGGVLLSRPGLVVKGQEIRAYLAQENEETAAGFEGPAPPLEKAFATGQVEMTETRESRVRQGWGERGVYQVRESQIELEGPAARMVESVRGVTQRTAQGKQLTWFSAREQLWVDGAEQRPAVANLRKK
jgi:lipopolysaccharide export system protein LptA